ncbi:four helix bundle protein [Pendulispora rubella]|uniref:Four helix bundle protein n=1 Tax=Pendulispora rubella TaxID=2741070 RepID=A0ABZ2L3Z8_9BACT
MRNGVAREAGVPKGHSALLDQLRRAALSVPLNIAEAAGRSSERDGARHYAIARGSAMECAAVIDALHVLGAVEAEEHARAVGLLERCVAMLTKLCQ